MKLIIPILIIAALTVIILLLGEKFLIDSKKTGYDIDAIWYEVKLGILVLLAYLPLIILAT